MKTPLSFRQTIMWKYKQYGITQQFLSPKITVFFHKMNNDSDIAKLLTIWLKTTKTVNILVRPSQSPGLSPIETFFQVGGKKIFKVHSFKTAAKMVKWLHNNYTPTTYPKGEFVNKHPMPRCTVEAKWWCGPVCLPLALEIGNLKNKKIKHKLLIFQWLNYTIKEFWHIHCLPTIRRQSLWESNDGQLVMGMHWKGKIHRVRMSQ